MRTGAGRRVSGGACRARTRPLLDRFQENRRLLIDAHSRIASAIERREHFGADSEWLLDNFHIVRDALNEIHNDLPHGYHSELPKLADSPLAGYPRIYSLALSLCAHTDSSFDEAKITRCVQAYQSVAPLTIGELWAVPTMLRLSLIENLRRLAHQMLRAWRDRHHLHSHRMDDAETFRQEQQRQAANQVSIGNCVTSLRLLSALDWTVFFERTSLVEAILRDDPAGIYALQEFATKDRYRRIVERLARGSRHDELAVARRALTLARRPAVPQWRTDIPTGPAPRTLQATNAETAASRATPALFGVEDQASHIGYYLIGEGRKDFEREVGFKPSLNERLLRLVAEHAELIYFGSFGALTALLLCLVLAVSGSFGAGVPVIALAFILSLLPATDLAVALVNHLITFLLPPRVLPRMDFKDGIPASCSTFIVMPTMLVGPESAALLLERLEVHFLSNPEQNFYYALLTDFADAPDAHMPEDDSYLRAALDGIRSLNARHCRAGRAFFPVPSNADVEPGPMLLDGLGT